MTQEQAAQETRPRHPRMTALLSFLQKEIVGNELLFTAAHARRVVEELGFHRPEDVWGTLRRLEERGRVHCKRKKGAGIVVSVNADEAGKSTPNVKLPP